MDILETSVQCRGKHLSVSSFLTQLCVALIQKCGCVDIKSSFCLSHERILFWMYSQTPQLDSDRRKVLVYFVNLWSNRHRCEKFCKKSKGNTPLLKIKFHWDDVSVIPKELNYFQVKQFLFSFKCNESTHVSQDTDLNSNRSL